MAMELAGNGSLDNLMGIQHRLPEAQAVAEAVRRGDEIPPTPDYAPERESRP